MDWMIKYRPNNSYWVEATHDYKKYIFTTHALVRSHQRSSNVNVISDLEKPVRRVIKCLTQTKVKRWMDGYQSGDRMIIHDKDVYMVCIVVRYSGYFEIITIFNEFTEAYRNYRNTPELWLDMKENYVVASMQ